MKKPDVFVWMVERVEERWKKTSTNGTVHLVPSHKAMKLLRAYHAKVVRLVKQHDGWERDAAGNMMSELKGEYLDRANLLAALARMKRGGK